MRTKWLGRQQARGSQKSQDHMRSQVNKSKDSIKKLKFSSNGKKKFKELKINKVAIDKAFEEYSGLPDESNVSQETRSKDSNDSEDEKNSSQHSKPMESNHSQDCKFLNETIDESSLFKSDDYGSEYDMRLKKIKNI